MAGQGEFDCGSNEDELDRALGPLFRRAVQAELSSIAPERADRAVERLVDSLPKPSNDKKLPQPSRL